MSELRIERVYAVAPERLFAFVTEAANLIQWWGPDGTSAAEAQLDLTRPGPWSLVLVTPAGGRFIMRGVVRSAVRPSSVEFTMNVPGEDVQDSTVRFEIEPDGKGGSRFTLIQSGITDEMVKMGQHGWGSTLGRLERLMGVTNRAA